jgi:hypothetical protein
MSDNSEEARITDVLQIIPATDWWFFDPFKSYHRDRRALVPVVCFALVESKIPGHEDQPMKHTIPLSMEHFTDLPGLIGLSVGRREREVYHVSQLEDLEFEEDPTLRSQANIHDGNETAN